jgi:hypothetical protein
MRGVAGVAPFFVLFGRSLIDAVRWSYWVPAQGEMLRGVGLVGL